MPNVYIINKCPHDFHEAERYGTLVFLSKGQMNKYAVNKIYRQFEEALGKSTADDYILLTSLTVMSVVACCIFVLKHQMLNLLLYKDDSYVCRKLDLKGVCDGA
jgi:hypothetical protein